MTDRNAIDAHGLHKRFGDLQVLKSVDLSVRSGEVVVIMGPSGSGKTTLLRCLNLLERPDAGTVTVRGRTVDCSARGSGRGRARLIRDIRIRTAMVFQQYNLFPHMTVLQNVVEGPLSVRRLPRPYAVEVGERLLERVGLADKRDEYPSRLSGGQKQRVAIARALAMDPEVVLLDEPTSSLDPELRGEVLQVLRDLAARGTTMVIVTHEIAFAREVADRVLFMDSGYILEEQPPRTFFTDPASTRVRSFLRLMTGVESQPELGAAG
ncbi:amino acid ABC transporter ATP-binding protein [Microbispora sp. RL4-1S]|uniref:Amino acid ABC transporter ATP-binding protein n=1 Tax=Microbispora oryzae TaxID=2806554 RepID=A0A940WIE8_9ACTN|nr:amino acid ABC transporter ATP-binding protein [Microbispora oryzae]MBP2706175.1 amino acid ABC transporter ATP-binding protein [Microbispora oryzae]